jgi:hypothetical protein
MSLLHSKAEATPRKLANEMQPQLPRNIADFKQAIGFLISRCTLRKVLFEQVLTSTYMGMFIQRTSRVFSRDSPGKVAQLTVRAIRET